MKKREPGGGISEAKIGRTMSGRRSEFFLATKCRERTHEEAEASIDSGLSVLRCSLSLPVPSLVLGINREEYLDLAGKVPTAEVYVRRERLKNWFRQSEKAQNICEILNVQGDPDEDCSFLNPLCPCDLNINRKLKPAHSKLSRDLVLV